MTLTFLGTGAAVCTRKPDAQIQEGERRCSSVLIDGNVLVDVPFQSFDYAARLGGDLSKLTDVFLTHSHDDHFIKEVLFKFAASAKSKLNFWCHKGAVENLGLAPDEAARVNIYPVEAMQKWETAGMTVTALPANHLTKGDEQPLHYIFEKDGKSTFYGCDGGWFMARTWEYMRKIKLDAVVLDTTVGEDGGNFRIGTHNTIPMLRLISQALTENGIMSEGGVRIGSHIAPTVHKMTHSETAKVLAEFGMITAYDGFEVEV